MLSTLREGLASGFPTVTPTSRSTSDPPGVKVEAWLEGGLWAVRERVGRSVRERARLRIFRRGWFIELGVASLPTLPFDANSARSGVAVLVDGIKALDVPTTKSA